MQLSKNHSATPLSVMLLCVGLGSLALASACGGAKQAPKPVATATADDADRRPPPEMLADIGALDPDDIDRAFRRTQGTRFECVKAGRAKNQYLAGEVKFYFEVDQAGKAQNLHILASNMGDRDTEKCLLQALADVRWPTPQGGRIGIVKEVGMGLPADEEVRVPHEWSSSNLDEVIERSKDEFASCKAGSSAGFVATLYVERSGKVKSVGMSVDDKSGADKIDCLVEKLKELKLPSPGDWIAKVSVRL